MSEETVLVERHDGWAEIILNRPERKNSLTGPLATGLLDAVQSVSADDAIRVAVIRGAGGAFCSGLDLREFNADPKPEWLPSFQPTWRAVHVALFQSSKTFIGALERYAINAGSALALACDLLVAGEEAYLQVGEVQQGIAAPMNAAWLRAKHSEALALRIGLIGDRILGPELVRLGLAVDSVPGDQVVARACALAEQLAGYPPSGLRAVKSSLRSLSAVTDAEEWFARPGRGNQRSAEQPLPPVR